MPKENPSWQKETEPKGPVINRLCAAVDMPGYSGNRLFLGWTAEGVPAAVTDTSKLSKQAKESFSITGSISYPYQKETGSRQIVPMEFISASKPINRIDPREQDILVYGVKDSNNEITFWKIKELDILEAIQKGHVEWEDVNQDSVSIMDEAIQPQIMNSLFVPIKNENGERVVNAILFPPLTTGGSGETAYQSFLSQTLASLITLDKLQKPGEKRGYQEAVNYVKAQSAGEGGKIFQFVEELKNLGALEVSDEELDQLKAETEGKSVGQQILVLAERAGWLKKVGNEPVKTEKKMEGMTTREMEKVLQVAYRLAYRAVK
jgi:hypothetical protein